MNNIGTLVPANMGGEVARLRDSLWNPNDADASLSVIALASYRLALRRAR